MATSLVTLEENSILDGSKLSNMSPTGSPTALSPNSPLVRMGSKESVVTTKVIRVDDVIGDLTVTIQVVRFVIVGIGCLSIFVCVCVCLKRNPIDIPVACQKTFTGWHGKQSIEPPEYHTLFGEIDDKKAVFLTVHDIGSNSNSMKDFVDSDCMSEIRFRSVFIHVDVCGQQNDAEDIENFPTIQQLGEVALAKILDQLNVPFCVGIGDGAGANILARFGLSQPHRVLGLVLINLVSAGVGFLESIKEKFLAKRRSSQQISSEEIVAMHKFGNASDADVRQLIDSYSGNVSKINAKNLRKYMTAYMNRREIAHLEHLDVLLVVGGKSPFVSGVEYIYAKCDKQKTALLKVDNVVDVVGQCPDKFAQSLLLFVKGLGFLTSLQMPGAIAGVKSTLGAIGRRRTLSMEEYDIPRMRRLSLTK